MLLHAYPPNGLTCFRCQRLHRECEPSSAPRKQRTAKEPPGTRIRLLEEKLDGLATLLQPRVLSVSTVTNPIRPLRVDVDGITPISAISATSAMPSSDYSHVQTKLNESLALNTSASNIVSSDMNNLGRKTYAFCGYEPTVVDVEECFENFRKKFVKFFPCFIIPKSVTGHDFR